MADRKKQDVTPVQKQPRTKASGRPAVGYVLKTDPNKTRNNGITAKSLAASR